MERVFEFPKMYIQMENDGFFDVNTFTCIEECKNYGYMWFYDMEWLTCDEIVNYEYDDESRKVIPFASTSGGDKWAWYLNDNEELPVVFCPHDSEKGVFYAENLQGAMFRHILEFVSECNFYVNGGESWQMNEFLAKEYLACWKERLNHFFNKEWIAEIDNIIKLKLKSYTDEFNDRYYVFITPEEAKEKIMKYLNFNLLDENFKWLI